MIQVLISTHVGAATETLVLVVVQRHMPTLVGTGMYPAVGSSDGGIHRYCYVR